MSGAVFWFAELGRSGGEDSMLPSTVIVVGVSLPLAYWQVRGLQEQALVGDPCAGYATSDDRTGADDGIADAPA